MKPKLRSFSKTLHYFVQFVHPNNALDLSLNKPYIITYETPRPTPFVAFLIRFIAFNTRSIIHLCYPRLLGVLSLLYQSLCSKRNSLKKMSASIFTTPVAGSGYVGLKPNSKTFLPVNDSIAWSRKTISNGSRTSCMKTWNPINNKKFEALSYLPPLSDESIAKEVDYMLRKGWIPCIEFDEVGYVHRENSRMPGYYDGRYWTLWKLPMFGCNDSTQVLNEIRECKEAYPNAYVRLLAFDNEKQAQCMAFVIQKPTTT